MKYLSKAMQKQIDNGLEGAIEMIMEDLSYRLETGEFESKEDLIQEARSEFNPDHYHDVSLESEGGIECAIYCILSDQAGNFSSTVGKELKRRVEKLADAHDWDAS